MSELVRGGHFDHPVQHPCSQGAIDQVIAQEGLRLVLVVRLVQQILSIQLAISHSVILGLGFWLTPHGHCLVALIEVNRLGVVGKHSVLPLVAVLQIVLLLVEGFAVSDQLLHSFINIFINNTISHPYKSREMGLGR